jgi:hypothetical protein
MERVALIHGWTLPLTFHGQPTASFGVPPA